MPLTFPTLRHGNIQGSTGAGTRAETYRILSIAERSLCFPVIDGIQYPIQSGALWQEEMPFRDSKDVRVPRASDFDNFDDLHAMVSAYSKENPCFISTKILFNLYCKVVT